jgi:hypothetical protein
MSPSSLIQRFTDEMDEMDHWFGDSRKQSQATPCSGKSTFGSSADLLGLLNHGERKRAHEGAALGLLPK